MVLRFKVLCSTVQPPVVDTPLTIIVATDGMQRFSRFSDPFLFVFIVCACDELRVDHIALDGFIPLCLRREDDESIWQMVLTSMHVGTDFFALGTVP